MIPILGKDRLSKGLNIPSVSGWGSEALCHPPIHFLLFKFMGGGSEVGNKEK